MVNVLNRSGNIEELSINKIHRVVTWAAKGL
jgi:hypothetical protein